MKKLLLACVFSVFTNSMYSQLVDIIGVGVKNEYTSKLVIPDLENIRKVEVGAFYISLKYKPGNEDVIFKNFKQEKFGNWNDDVIKKHTLDPNYSIGYFSESFDEVNESGISFSKEYLNRIHSFYSYIFREDLTFEYKSYLDLTPVFYYRNGENNPYIYNIPIETSQSSRQIKVKIPVSELNDDDRVIAIKIQAGPVTFNTEVKKWNNGESFFLGEYILKNIPGNVTNVSVSIYSPKNENGDSFFVSGVVVDVEKVGCTYTQGYWKNHSECKKNGNGPKRDATWDKIGEGNYPETTTLFFKSEKTYCDVYATQPNNKNGKYYILAHQYIATELNLHNNSDPTDIAQTFKEATHFLEEYTPEDVRNSKNLQSQAVKLGGKLDDYNNGKIGRGHCDDNDDDDTDEVQHTNRVERIIIKETLHAKKINIFPNPAVNQAQISFETPQSGETSIELFNMNGQKVADLYKGTNKKNSNLLIEFKTTHLKKGIYVAIIKNGNNIYRHKIAISD